MAAAEKPQVGKSTVTVKGANGATFEVDPTLEWVKAQLASGQLKEAK